jgi:hypothetical protein
VQQSRDPLKVVDERSICASVRLAKPRDVLAWNAPSNSAYFPLTPQEIGSASYEVHQAAARFIRVVREASRESSLSPSRLSLFSMRSELGPQKRSARLT